MAKRSNYEHHTLTTECRGVEIEVSILEVDGRYRPEAFIWEEGPQPIPNAPLEDSIADALAYASAYAAPFVDDGE